MKPVLDDAPAASARRVLVGVCGVGNGHASQSQALVTKLLARGHRVVLITFGDGLRALRDAFPVEVPIVVPTHFPGIWVEMGPHGIDLAASAANGRALDARGDAWSFDLCEQVIEHLGGEPDIVLTDYEPASAQVAYMIGAPLVTTELHGKFLMYQTPDVGRFSRWTEAAKLRYFFPAADRRISTSFFPMDWASDDRYPGEVLEPILRSDVTSLSPESDPDTVVVYMSPYGPMRQTPEEILEILGRFPALRFEVFHKEPVQRIPTNVSVSPFDRERFVKVLATSSGVVSTAGHSLISECLYLHKPVLGIPFDNYEQRFNAAMLEHCGIGMHTDLLASAQVEQFLGRREEFAENARQLARRRFTGDSADVPARLGL